MKVIRTKYFPPKGYKAINLFGIVFSKATLKEKELNHEAIHTAQIKELWYIGFYILYLLFFLTNLIDFLSWRKAYKNIPFEREAYYNQENPDYLKTRKKFNWTYYIK